MTNGASAGGVQPPARKGGALKVVLVLCTFAAMVVATVVVYTLTINFVARPYLIPSESMAPRLKPGDRIMVSKFAYRKAAPKPGDVIVFRSPAGWAPAYTSIRSQNNAVRWLQDALSTFGLVPPDESDQVKRIIAVGGQTVECRAGAGLTVDGKRLTEPYLDPATMAAAPHVYPCLGNEFGPVTVPEDRLWVMGDNRTHSADSRARCTNVPADVQRGVLCTGDPKAGTVPVDNVIGKVTRLFDVFAAPRG